MGRAFVSSPISPTPRLARNVSNFSDPQTKYLAFRVWMRHLHYTHNLAGDPPPPVEKAAKKKGPSVANVLSGKEKEKFLLTMGL